MEFTRTSQQFSFDEPDAISGDDLGDYVRSVLEQHLKQVLEGVANRLCHGPICDVGTTWTRNPADVSHFQEERFPRQFRIDVRLEQDGLHYKWVAILNSNEEATK